MLDCIIKENDAIDYAIELGLSGIAITDHEALCGHVKAAQYLKSLKTKAKKILEDSPNDDWANKVNNFTLGLGNEIYLCKDSLNAKTYEKGKDKYWHFILIAKDLEGHKQLRLLSSRAWERSYYQFIERVPTYYSDIEEIVGKNPGHLIATSACLGGQLPKFILDNDIQKAENFCNWCLNNFGKENFFIEIQPGRSKEQITFNTLVIPFAKKMNIPVVVATDAHYLKEEDRSIHKAFLNSRDGDRETDDFYEATYMMSEEELRKRMDYLNDEIFQEIINNTQKEKCGITEYSLFHKQIVPRIPLDFSVFGNATYDFGSREYIKKFFNSPFEEDRYFINTVFKNGTKLDILDSIHLDRIEEECKTIWEVSEKISERLSAYFTTVAKIIDIGWEQAGTLIGPWRGSVGGSLCAYLVEITQRDPLKSPIELPFWRFLSLGRAELPDIDVDSQASRREFYIEKIREYYESIGGELVNVATFGTETSKAALVTAARGLGYEPEIGTYLSGLIPIDRGHVRELQYCYEGNEEKGWKPIPQFVKEMGIYEDIWKVAQKIEGLISRRGLHASGIIVTNGPVTDYCATMKGPNGVICTQLELHDSEFCGLLKFDCLTVDALDVIHKCMDLLIEYGYMDWQGSLKTTYMKYLDPDKINYSDKGMWEQAWNGNISKLFQYETPVGSQTIKLIKPESLLQLSQSNSLMRLVPEAGQKTPAEEFSEYKKNPDLIWEEICRLNATSEEKKILYDFMKPVGGVLDTQELAMMAVMLPFTKYNVDESNKIRKVIAKKKLKEIDFEREKYFQRGKELGTSEDILHYIWDVQLKRQLGYSLS